MITETICLTLIFLVYNVYSAKILAVSTIASVSHQIVFQPIWKELSLRGHEVTVLTPNILKDSSLINMTEIDLGFLYQVMEEHKEDLSKGMDHWKLIGGLGSFAQISAVVFSSEKVQKFIKDNSKSYDVVVAEMMDPVNYAFAARFKCPIIGIVSSIIPNSVHEALGNPLHPVLHPDFHAILHRDEMSSFDKVDAVLFDWYERYIFNYIYYSKVNDIVKEYFGDAM